MTKPINPAVLGLALKAIQALGLSIRIQHEKDTSAQQANNPEMVSSTSLSGYVTLANVIARATITNTAPSKVTGWPGAAPPKQRDRLND